MDWILQLCSQCVDGLRSAFGGLGFSSVQQFFFFNVQSSSWACVKATLHPMFSPAVHLYLKTGGRNVEVDKKCGFRLQM